MNPLNQMPIFAAQAIQEFKSYSRKSACGPVSGVVVRTIRNFEVPNEEERSVGQLYILKLKQKMRYLDS